MFSTKSSTKPKLASIDEFVDPTPSVEERGTDTCEFDSERDSEDQEQQQKSKPETLEFKCSVNLPPKDKDGYYKLKWGDDSKRSEREMTGLEYTTQLYKQSCKYTGAAITILYYIQNTPGFYQQSFGGQLYSLVLPCVTGLVFGRVITPVSAAIVGLKQYFNV